MLARPSSPFCCQARNTPVLTCSMSQTLLSGVRSSVCSRLSKALDFDTGIAPHRLFVHVTLSQSLHPLGHLVSHGAFHLVPSDVFLVLQHGLHKFQIAKPKPLLPRLPSFQKCWLLHHAGCLTTPTYRCSRNFRGDHRQNYAHPLYER